MTLSELVSAHGGQAGLATALKCDKSYVNRAVKRGKVGPALAVRIYRATGHKIGPCEGATPKQIEMMELLSLRSAA